MDGGRNKGRKPRVRWWGQLLHGLRAKRPRPSLDDKVGVGWAGGWYGRGKVGRE